MASHSTIRSMKDWLRNFYSVRGGQRQDSDQEEDEYSDEEEEDSAEYSRLHQILHQYTWDSQYPDTGELRRLLNDVTGDEKLRLLRRYETLKEAAMRCHSEMISTNLSSLSPHQRLEVLSERDMFDRTPLHCAALYGNTDSVKMILSQLTSDQQLTLLSMRDEYGHTPADRASVYGKKETERLLRDYEQRANQLTEAVTRHENPPVRHEDIAAGLQSALHRIRELEDRLRVQQNNSTEVFARYENLLVRHDDLTAKHEDLAAVLVRALDRIRELEDQLRVQQNNSAEVVTRHEDLLVRHGDLTAKHEELLVMHGDLTASHEDLAAGHESALDRIRELEDRLRVQQNNSAGHGCSSTTQQTSNGLDQMLYDVIAKRERDNEELQALHQMVLNNSAGLSRVNDRTQENRNILTAEGLHEAVSEQPEDYQSEDEDAENPDMDGNGSDENET